MKDINPTIDKQLESYLDGQLQGDELKNIEKMIQDNPTIVEELAFRKSFRFVVNHKDDFQFNHKVRQAMDSVTIQPDHTTNWNNNSSWTQIIGISIGVIAIGLLSWWMLTQPAINTQQQTINTIIDEYLTPFENKLNDDSEGNLGQGLTAYDNQQYDIAAQQLQLYTNAIPVDTVPQFYLGLSYLLNNQPNEAIPYLQNITNSSEDFMIPHAQWYLGLAYLQLENTEKAKQSFESIKNNPLYQEKISAILIRIE